MVSTEETLTQVLEWMEEVFPLPVAQEGENFKGRHYIYMENSEWTNNQPRLAFHLWYRGINGDIRCRPAGPDPEEEITRDWFIQVKLHITQADQDEM